MIRQLFLQTLCTHPVETLVMPMLILYAAILKKSYVPKQLKNYSLGLTCTYPKYTCFLYYPLFSLIIRKTKQLWKSHITVVSSNFMHPMWTLVSPRLIPQTVFPRLYQTRTIKWRSLYLKIIVWRALRSSFISTLKYDY